MSDVSADDVCDELYRAFPALSWEDKFIRRWCRETADKIVERVVSSGRAAGTNP